jgi:hypothetical protein
LPRLYGKLPKGRSGMVPVMAHTSIAFPKQGPGLSDGIALAKFVTSPTMNQIRRAPVVKVAEEVAHRQKVAVWDRTLVSESVERDRFMLGEMDVVQPSTREAKARRVDRV